MPVARIRQDEAAFAVAGFEPIRRPDRAPVRAAGDAELRVVLLRSVNVVWKSVVHGDVIKLRGRLVVLRRPGFAAVDGNARAAVVGVPDPIGILRINPEPVMIAMTCRQQVKGLAAIDRMK